MQARDSFKEIPTAVTESEGGPSNLVPAGGAAAPSSAGEVEQHTFKKKLSGAQRRARRRAQTMAASGSKVVDPTSTTGQGGHKETAPASKRIRSSDSSTPDGSRPRKRPNLREVGAGQHPAPMSYSSAAKPELRVVIVLDGHPEGGLSEEEGMLVLEGLENAIDLLGPEVGYVLCFESGRVARGALQVTISRILWKGPKLQLMEARDFFRGVKVMIWTPGHTAGPESILHRLGRQNSSLKTKEWRVVAHEKMEKEKEKEEKLVVIMREEAVAELRKLNLRPYFGLRRAKCVVLGTRVGKGVRQEAQVTEQTTQQEEEKE